MSATTKENYARRRCSEANRLSQQRATAWSDSDDRQLQVNGEQADRRPSDTDSQTGDQASNFSEEQKERPVTPVMPAAPATIPMEAQLALTQALEPTNPGLRTEIRPPNLNGEGDLSLFLKQFDDEADANNLTLVQRTLHLRSQLTGDAQGCGHGDSYQKIVEDLKIKTSQSIHSQAAEVTRMVKVAFPTLANTDRRAMALEYFTRAWEGKNIQRHLLVVAAATIKKTVHASEEYLDVSESEQTLRAMPVEQMGLPPQPSALEVSLKVMTQQTALLQQVLKKIRQPSTRQQKNCFKCGGPHMQQDCLQGSKQQSTTKAAAAENGRGPAQV